MRLPYKKSASTLRKWEPPEDCEQRRNTNGHRITLAAGLRTDYVGRGAKEARRPVGWLLE